MWKNKYFIISLFLVITQLANVITSVLLSFSFATISFATFAFFITLLAFFKIAYDLKKEGWENL